MGIAMAWFTAPKGEKPEVNEYYDMLFDFNYQMPIHSGDETLYDVYMAVVDSDIAEGRIMNTQLIVFYKYSWMGVCAKPLRNDNLSLGRKLIV